MRDLIKDTLPLIEEEKKALAPGGFELGTSRLRDHPSNHYATTTALIYNCLLDRFAGSAYREMVHNIISPIVTRPDVTLCRYDIHHALPSNTTNTIIGRAAHIAVLDSELFIEKFLIISVIKYFQ